MVAVRQKPVEFKILHNINADVLGQRITELLLKDWMLHGDLKTVDGFGFCQAMVRVEQERMPTPQASSILVPRPILG